MMVNTQISEHLALCYFRCLVNNYLMVSDVGVNTKVITLPCAISDDGEQRPYGE